MTGNNEDDSDNQGDDRMPTGELRSFGRRRGRKASDRQRTLLTTLLPRVGVDVARLAAEPGAGLAALFGKQCAQIWLEIGFGGGEHLIWQARANPEVGVIGCEPFEDGVVKVLDAIDREAIGNVRVLADDARPLLRALPTASIDRAFILFPDPWPKRRHQKRRLVQPPLVAELARVMKPGAELRIATDIADYARTALLAVCGNSQFLWIAAEPADWRTRPADWPPTRYESKATREGRRSYYFRFCRRE